MSDSLVIDVAVGLIFTFAVFAALTSALTEAVSRFLGLRGDYLLKGLRALVDGDQKSGGDPTSSDPNKLSAAALWGHLGGEPSGVAMAAPASATDVRMPDPPAPPAPPQSNADRFDAASALPTSQKLLSNALLGSQGMKSLGWTPEADLTFAMKRDLPSYISSRSFASAVLALLIPDASGNTTMDEVVQKIGGLPNGVLKKSLQSLAASSAGDVNRFRDNVEAWYDDHMARVSGWYKRHVRWISIAIGAVLVVGANVSAIALGRGLYTDQAVRESVVTQAVAGSNCASVDAATCLDQARNAITKLRSGGLPVGWGTVPACQIEGSSCSWLQRYGLTSVSGGGAHQAISSLWLLLGWALTAFALMPGARFWFDILGKLGTLRSTGPKPASA